MADIVDKVLVSWYLAAKFVHCDKCKYAGFSKSVDYAYVCKNAKSPCHKRIVVSDFGCVYGKEEGDEDGR